MMAIPAPIAAILQRFLAFKSARWVLATAVAALLVAVLGFLYFKTQGADIKRKNEALALLRELKEIDVRWDVDLWRTRLEFTTTHLRIEKCDERQPFWAADLREPGLPNQEVRSRGLASSFAKLP